MRFLATPSGFTMDRVRSIATKHISGTGWMDAGDRRGGQPALSPQGPGTSGDFKDGGFYRLGAGRGNEIRRLDGDLERKRLFQTVKLSPQPHSSLTFGLWNWKDSFRPFFTKSTWVPSRKGRLSRSTTTCTPWSSNTTSLALWPWA